jgi:DNA polymerase-3 subunit delta
MSNPSPSIYLLHGSDEFAIQTFLKEGLIPKMGDSADASMDITSLEGKNLRLEALQAETHTVPFLSKRRMVILKGPAEMVKGKADQEKFKEYLLSVPESTALVLVEGVLEKPQKGDHWLLTWAREHPQQCWNKAFTAPTGGGMTHWIEEQVASLKGEIDSEAARLLASYIEEDPRLAKNEIIKLLTYVDYSRPITERDVKNLVSDVRQGDVFEMVDAIGYGDGVKAMQMLRRLLEEGDALPLFGMIVRQFRLLIQVRELLDEDPAQDHKTIADKIGSHPYPVQKILPQARLFNLDQLKAVYHQLSEVDLAIKTGQLEGGLALDLLIASLTQ